MAASDRTAGRFADRVARARQPLRILAVLGVVFMLGSVVLLLLALRGAGV